MNGQIRRGWLAGLVVGMAGGLAALEIPPIGYLVLVGFGIGALVSGPRLAAIGGLLTGLGGIWLAIVGRLVIQCPAELPNELGCHAPGMAPWLIDGGAMVAIGLLLTATGWWRSRRARAASAT